MQPLRLGQRWLRPLCSDTTEPCRGGGSRRYKTLQSLGFVSPSRPQPVSVASGKLWKTGGGGALGGVDGTPDGLKAKTPGGPFPQPRSPDLGNNRGIFWAGPGQGGGPTTPAGVGSRRAGQPRVGADSVGVSASRLATVYYFLV